MFMLLFMVQIVWVISTLGENFLCDPKGKEPQHAGGFHACTRTRLDVPAAVSQAAEHVAIRRWFDAGGSPLMFLCRCVLVLQARPSPSPSSRTPPSCIRGRRPRWSARWASPAPHRRPARTQVNPPSHPHSEIVCFLPLFVFLGFFSGVF